MAHIFISYSRKNQPYVRRLAEEIRQRGFDVWMDDRIDYGDNWWRAIVKAIEDCAAFVVIMSPDAEQSEWVQREILLAQREEKPIFPALLEGKEFALLITTQFVNVTGNIMPPEDFYKRIAEVITPSAVSGSWIAPQKHPTTRRMILVVAVLVFLSIVTIGLIGLSQAGSPSPTIAGAGTPTTPDLTRTLDAMVTSIISTNAAEETLAVAAFTPTPTPSATPTATDTPDTMKTLAAQNTEAAIIAANSLATQHAQLTANAPTDTLEPTATPTETATLTLTPTASPSPTPTATLDFPATNAAATQVRQEALATVNAQGTMTVLSETSQPSGTMLLPTATLTPTLLLERLALTPIMHNADWTPYERDFDGVTMVLVPAGCFMMGSDNSNNGGNPVHEQCFGTPFWIDKYEVTQADFVRLGGQKTNQDYFRGDQRPVENITWFESRDFCESRAGRLPTEAEWEYAARGPDGSVYPWGNEFLEGNVVYYANSDHTVDVGSKPNGASWVGALDMVGNVWEWTSSLYMNYPYRVDHESSDNTTDARVMRGSSFSYTRSLLLAATRSGKSPDSVYTYLGFRCIRDFD